jgi:hypothetical protein
MVLRSVLIGALKNLTVNQDATVATVTSWANSAVSLSQTPSELSVSSSMQLVDIVEAVVVASSTMKLPYTLVSKILSAVDAIFGSLQGMSAPPPYSTAVLSNLLQMYSNYVLSQMTGQQFDEVYSFSSFKIVAGVKPVSATGKSLISLSSPLTASEVFSGAQSDQFSLETVVGVSNVKGSLLMTKQVTLNNQQALPVHSNPFTLLLPDLSVCASTGCIFKMVLSHVQYYIHMIPLSCMLSTLIYPR